MRSRTSKLLLGITVRVFFLANRMAGSRGVLAHKQLGIRLHGNLLHGKFFEVNRAASMEADSLQDRKRGAANARWIFVSIRQGFRRYAGEAFPFVGQPFECQETNLANNASCL